MMDPDMFGMSYNDMLFLYMIGAADFDVWASLLMFQTIVDKHGSPEDQARLEAMNVGYHPRPRPTGSLADIGRMLIEAIEKMSAKERRKMRKDFLRALKDGQKSSEFRRKANDGRQKH